LEATFFGDCEEEAAVQSGGVLALEWLYLVLCCTYIRGQWLGKRNATYLYI